MSTAKRKERKDIKNVNKLDLSLEKYFIRQKYFCFFYSIKYLSMLPK